jgi:PAS domain S-box-containing protein
MACTPLLIFALCGVAHADNALEQWRNKAGEIRLLAENDTQRAYTEAEHLQAGLPADATPADRARLLNLLARIEMNLAETDKAALHIEQAMEIARQHNDPVGQAEADLNAALNAINQAKIDDAIAAADHALSVLDGVDRPDLLGEALLRMAMMYRRFNQFDESVTMALQAMDIARQSNNPLVLAYAHHGLAITYEQSERYAEGLEQYELMLEHAKLTGSGLMQAYALKGLGQCVRGLGNLKDSERMLREAIAIFHRVGSPFNLNFGLYGLADILYQQGRYAETLPLLDEAIARYQRYSNKIGLWWTLNARSRSRMAVGDSGGARRDVEQAYALAEEIGVPVYLTDSAKRLAEIAAANGDHHQAYRFMREASEMAAKMAKDTAAMRVLQLTRRYQNESKQREIDKLNRRNQQQAAELKQQSLEQRWLWTVLGGSVIMLAGTGFFLMRLRRSHHSLAMLNTEVLQAKNKLQATLDAIPDLMFEVGLDGRYYDCHSPHSDFLAAPVEQLLGRTVADVMSADAAAVCLAALHEADQHGRSLGKQLLLSLPHGDFWFELSVAAKPAVAGEEPRFIVMSRNITERKQAVEALAAREREFRTLAESLPDNILRYDKDGGLLYVNPELEKTLGGTYTDKLGMTVREFFPNGEFDDYALLLDSVLASGKSGEMEKIVLAPDNGLHTVHNIRMIAERGDNGEVIGVLAIGRDITERKLAEEALRDSEEKYRTLVEKIQAAVIVHDADTQILVSNPLAQEILGLTADQLHGKTAIDPAWHFHHEDGRLLTPEEYPVNQVLASGKALKNCVFGVHRPDRQEKVWVLVNADPVFGKDDAIIQVIVTFIDITQRKRTERELVLLNRAMDTSSDAAFLMDEQGRLIYVNDTACRSLGYSREELIGMSPLDIDPNMTPEIYQMLLDEAFSIGPQGAIESLHRNRDGHIFPVELAASVIEVDGTKFCLSMARDITERNAYMQDLQRWRHIFEYVEWGVVVSNPDSGMLELMNPAFAQMHGYSVEELTGRPVNSILAPEFQESIAEQVGLAYQKGHHVFETWHLRKDGSVFPVFIDMTSVFEENSHILHYIINVQDITERKRAEHDIAIMSQALGKVHEAAYLTDENGGFLYVNDASCRALGYSRDELLTMSVMDIGPGWTVEMVRNVLQRPADEAVQAFEAVHLRKDGSRFPVEINASQFEYAGKSYGLALVRDITERKRAEDEILTLNAELEQRVLERTEELRLQTRYLRTLIDTLPMMAWLKDKQSRFLVVNQTMALAGALDVDEMVGKSDLDCWPCDYAESYRAGDSEVMATAQRKTVEEIFVDARNNMMWVETFKAPVLDEDGSVLGTVGIARDISDRKAMDAARASALAEAERLAQLRSEFMSRMSHELRTPLNGILGYAQILLGESKGNERQHTMLNVIQQSGDYLLSLINDILDFAKIEAGKQELNLGNVPLRRFLRSLSNIVTIKVEQKGLFFMCDIAEAVPAEIRADETRLRQVLLNLLSNAVKYTERGQVSLRVTVLDAGACIESSRLRFEIQDTGVGIDNAQLDTIFQAFEQVGSNQQRTGGTGLGLPISRELVKLMGGNIQVSSRVGEGSSFWFDLDVPVVEVCGDILVDEQPIAGYHGLRRRILVVDDVDENRALLIEILGGLGFETCEAANGRACLDSVEAKTPDLILLDRVMPEMDGLETVRRLRRLPGFGETPVIVVSASALVADITEAMNAGANTFLPKPIEIKRLMAQLAGLLKLDWIYALSETGIPPQYRLNEALVEPPLEEMAILHHLAQEGSMRDIIRYAAHLEELDPRYRPFAAQLRVLAQGYQSKAILELVERYIPPSQL